MVVRGEVDDYTAPILRTALTEATAHNPASVRLDLSDVSFFSYAGMRVLIDFSRRAGRPVTIASRSACVERVLRLVGVDLDDLTVALW